MKTCSRCKQVKDKVAFAKQAKTSDGLQSWCRSCNTEHHRDWARRNPDKIRAARERADKTNIRNTHRYWATRRRGVLITREEFDAALLITECQLCSKPVQAGSRTHHLDHDHETGQFRGVLCQGCNTTLGHFGESLELMRKAIAYLEDAKARFDPNSLNLPPMPGRTGRKKITDER